MGFLISPWVRNEKFINGMGNNGYRTGSLIQINLFSIHGTNMSLFKFHRGGSLLWLQSLFPINELLVSDPKTNKKK